MLLNGKDGKKHDVILGWTPNMGRLRHVSKEERKTLFGGKRFWIWFPLFLALWVVVGILVVRHFL